MVSTRSQLRRKRSVGDAGENHRQKRSMKSKLGPAPSQPSSSPSPPPTSNDGWTDALFQAAVYDQEKRGSSPDSLFGEEMDLDNPGPFASFARTRTADRDLIAAYNDVPTNLHHSYPPFWTPAYIVPDYDVNSPPARFDETLWPAFQKPSRNINPYITLPDPSSKIHYLNNLYSELAHVLQNMEHQYWMHTRAPVGDATADRGIWPPEERKKNQAEYLTNMYNLIRMRTDRIKLAFEELAVEKLKEYDSDDFLAAMMWEAVEKKVENMKNEMQNLQAHYVWILNRQARVMEEHGVRSLVETPTGGRTPDQSFDEETEKLRLAQKTNTDLDFEIQNALKVAEEFGAGVRYAVDHLVDHDTIPGPRQAKFETYMQDALDAARIEGLRVGGGPVAGVLAQGVERAATEFIMTQRITGCGDLEKEVDEAVTKIRWEAQEEAAHGVITKDFTCFQEPTRTNLENHVLNLVGGDGKEIINAAIDQLIKEGTIRGPREQEVLDYLKSLATEPEFWPFSDESQREFEARVYQEVTEVIKDQFAEHYEVIIRALQRGVNRAGGWNTLDAESYVPGDPKSREYSFFRLFWLSTEIFFGLTGEYLFQFLKLATTFPDLSRFTVIVWSIFAVFQLFCKEWTAEDDMIYIEVGQAITQALDQPFLHRINLASLDPYTFSLIRSVLFYLYELRTYTYLYTFLFLVTAQHLTLFIYTLLRNSTLIGHDAWLSGTTTREYAFISCLAFSLGLSSILFSTQPSWTSSIQWASILSLTVGTLGLAMVWGEALSRGLQDRYITLEEAMEMNLLNTFPLHHIPHPLNPDGTEKELTETEKAALEKDRADKKRQHEKELQARKLRAQYRVYIRFLMGGLILGLSIATCLTLSWIGLFGPQNLLIRSLHTLFSLAGTAATSLTHLIRHGLYVLGELGHLLGGIYIQFARATGLPYTGRGGVAGGDGDYHGWVEAWWKGGEVEVLARGGFVQGGEEAVSTEAVLEVERFLVGRFEDL